MRMMKWFSVPSAHGSTPFGGWGPTRPVCSPPSLGQFKITKRLEKPSEQQQRYQQQQHQQQQ